jgi:hypothetical protein
MLSSNVVDENVKTVRSLAPEFHEDSCRLSGGTFDPAMMLTYLGINTTDKVIQIVKNTAVDVVHTAFNYLRHTEELEMQCSNLMKTLIVPDHPDVIMIGLCCIYTCLYNLTEKLFDSKIFNTLLKTPNPTMASLQHVMNGYRSLHFSEHYKAVKELDGCELIKKLFNHTIRSMEYPAELQMHVNQEVEEKNTVRNLRKWSLKAYNDARAVLSTFIRRIIEKDADFCNSDTVQVDSVCFYNLLLNFCCYRHSCRHWKVRL